MELQRYISEHSDYLSCFKQHGLKVRKKKHLALVKYSYDHMMDLTDESFTWMRYCRGAIIDTESHKVVCCPPIKARELQHGDYVSEDNDYDYQPIIDGTMINLFYDTKDQEWILSTRGEIGANNRWDTKMSFKQMFDECHSGIDYETLDKGLSYSFVMRHTKNRIVAPVQYNELYLVEIYSYQNGIKRLEVSEYPETSFHRVETVTDVNEFMDIYDKPLPYYIKGFTMKMKGGTQRYKYLNPNYLYVKNLKPNTNNPHLNYLELRGSGMLREYLSYYPEYTDEYNGYRDQLHKLSNELYTTYKNVHVYKKTEKKDIPFHMRPLIYEIHGKYLETREPTTWSHIKDYIHDLPPKKLMFALNYCDK